ncbi:MAG: hypothetical protein ACOX6S_06350 [Clostridia bacterium]|jgi:riboflavin transporter FmnP
MKNFVLVLIVVIGVFLIMSGIGAVIGVPMTIGATAWLILTRKAMTAAGTKASKDPEGFILGALGCFVVLIVIIIIAAIALYNAIAP